MKNEAGIIDKVEVNSIAEELGIEKGDKVIEINGQRPEDLIDINFLITDEYVALIVEKPSGEEWLLEIEKEYNEDIGISFEESTFNGIKRCQNKCVFCFVEQMPPKLRETLYIKDDDYRMSFMHGNFVTFTNLTPENIERILRLRLSPLYVSVHTTNPDLREQMLNNRRAGEILPLLETLTDANLELHTQIVLCPDLNDKLELDRTINELADLWPQVRSIAVVPVGLTRFRENLASLRPFSRDEAKKVIAQVGSHQRDFLQKIEYPLVFLADEFYLLAEEAIPSKELYGGFPQVENGIGLVRLFLDSFADNKKMLPRFLSESRKITLVTGSSAAKILDKVVEELNRIDNLDASLEVIINRFFGETVTVAGLITGQDIYDQLADKKIEGLVFLPSVMFKAGEKVFIDGMTLEELEKKLSIKIKVIELENEAIGLIEEISKL